MSSYRSSHDLCYIFNCFCYCYFLNITLKINNCNMELNLPLVKNSTYYILIQKSCQSDNSVICSCFLVHCLLIRKTSVNFGHHQKLILALMAKKTMSKRLRFLRLHGSKNSLKLLDKRSCSAQPKKCCLGLDMVPMNTAARCSLSTSSLSLPLPFVCVNILCTAT